MQQKSNRASIIVAILAFILILGAVFILNQTFRNRSEDTRVVSSASSSSSSSSSQFSSEEEFSSSSESSFIDDVTENPDTDNQESSSSSNSSTRSGSASSVDTSDLTTGQAIVRVLSVNGSEYQIETVSSLGIESKFFASGAKTRVNLTGATLTQGKSYKVSITARDTPTGFALDRFIIVGEV
jgi:hypothetical protein